MCRSNSIQNHLNGSCKFCCCIKWRASRPTTCTKWFCMYVCIFVFFQSYFLTFCYNSVIMYSRNIHFYHNIQDLQYIRNKPQYKIIICSFSCFWKCYQKDVAADRRIALHTNMCDFATFKSRIHYGSLKQELRKWSRKQC